MGNLLQKNGSKALNKYLFLITVLVLFSFTQSTQRKYITLKNTALNAGEILKYRLHYSIFNAGEADIMISPKLYRVNNRVCFKYVIHGISVGAFSAITKVDDWFISYTDTSNLYPHRFDRDIKEGKYTLKETSNFNQNDTIVEVIKNSHDPEKKEVKKYSTPLNSHDMLSGFFFLRNIDFENLKVGETMDFHGFFENSSYKLSIKYYGTEVIKTDCGKFNAYKISPVMPDNQMFKKDESIVIWLSRDKNKIPLKCRAEMWVGGVELELKHYEGLRHDISKIK